MQNRLPDKPFSVWHHLDAKQVTGQAFLPLLTAMEQGLFPPTSAIKFSDSSGESASAVR
jgi:hypothetical protein